MPLILNQDGSKMSKRDVGAALGTYPEEGFLPEGVMNFLALLGWSPRTIRKFSPQELIERFSLEAVNHSAAKFDITKCRWVNQQHIIALPAEEFALRARPFCLKAGLPDSPILDAAIATVQTKVQTLAEVPDKIRFFLNWAWIRKPSPRFSRKPWNCFSNWRTGWNRNRNGMDMNSSAC